jgi:hypothetical protein
VSIGNEDMDIGIDKGMGTDYGVNLLVMIDIEILRNAYHR